MSGLQPLEQPWYLFYVVSLWCKSVPIKTRLLNPTIPPSRKRPEWSPAKLSLLHAVFKSGVEALRFFNDKRRRLPRRTSRQLSIGSRRRPKSVRREQHARYHGWRGIEPRSWCGESSRRCRICTMYTGWMQYGGWPMSTGEGCTGILCT